MTEAMLLRALSLARRGYQAHGADISPSMVGIARRRARELGISARFTVAGWVQQPKKIRGRFDLILCVGNAIGHCSGEREMIGALQAMHGMLKSGGVLYLDTRCWETYRKERVRFDTFSGRVVQDEHLIWLNVRHYPRHFADPHLIEVVMIKHRGGDTSVESYPVTYWPFRRAELRRRLKTVWLRRYNRHLCRRRELVFGDRAAWMNERASCSGPGGLSMRYYYLQHIEGYQRMKAEGKVAWGEIHGEEGFENFAARGFLAAVLPTLSFETPEPTAFNYGCGTGPDACFLAEHGFRVDAVDLIPTAIEIARQQAAARGLDIHYAVQDICDLPTEGKQYDLVVDSYCLQCIVFDAERQRVFSAVRARLKPSGYYLISTAIMDEEHQQLLGPEDTVTDDATGAVCTRYGDGIIDAETGIVLNPLSAEPTDLPDALEINGAWYLPHRRHLTPAQLDADLARAGFQVIYRYPEHAGSIVCVPQMPR